MRGKLFYAPRPKQLPDLASLEERRLLMSSALHAAKELRGISDGPRIPEAGEAPHFDRHLSLPQFGNPLALVMAGVIALDDLPWFALTKRHMNAARQLGRRELRRLAELAESQGINGDVMRHIVAFNGLAGGIPIAGVRKSISSELNSSGRVADVDKLIALLEQELPSQTAQFGEDRLSRLATIRPDLIGEAAIIEEFIRQPSRESEAGDVVRRSYSLAQQEAAHALIHIVQDFAYALEDRTATPDEKMIGSQVMAWLRELSSGLASPEQLLPLAEVLPRQTMVLRELAAELTSQLSNHFLNTQQENHTAARNAAIWLQKLSSRLSDLDQREDALEAARSAVHLYRKLAKDKSINFTANLASSLNTFAIKLGDLGAREEAREAAKEAVALYESLVEIRPNFAHFCTYVPEKT